MADALSNPAGVDPLAEFSVRRRIRGSEPLQRSWELVYVTAFPKEVWYRSAESKARAALQGNMVKKI